MTIFQILDALARASVQNLLALAALYFVPSVIAMINWHYHRGAIILLNILAGWTLVGWVAAYVWAFHRPLRQASERTRRPCPHCAELILPQANICPFCTQPIA